MAGDAGRCSHEACFGHGVAQERGAAHRIGIICLGTFQAIVLPLFEPIAFEPVRRQQVQRVGRQLLRGILLKELVRAGRCVGGAGPKAVVDADVISTARVIDVLEGTPEPVRQVFGDNVERDQSEQLAARVVIPVVTGFIGLADDNPVALYLDRAPRKVHGPRGQLNFVRGHGRRPGEEGSDALLVPEAVGDNVVKGWPVPADFFTDTGAVGGGESSWVELRDIRPCSGRIWSHRPPAQQFSGPVLAVARPFRRIGWNRSRREGPSIIRPSLPDGVVGNIGGARNGALPAGFLIDFGKEHPGEFVRETGRNRFGVPRAIIVWNNNAGWDNGSGRKRGRKVLAVLRVRKKDAG